MTPPTEESMELLTLTARAAGKEALALAQECSAGRCRGQRLQPVRFDLCSPRAGGRPHETETARRPLGFFQLLRHLQFTSSSIFFTKKHLLPYTVIFLLLQLTHTSSVSTVLVIASPIR